MRLAWRSRFKTILWPWKQQLCCLILWIHVFPWPVRSWRVKDECSNNKKWKMCRKLCLVFKVSAEIAGLTQFKTLIQPKNQPFRNVIVWIRLCRSSSNCDVDVASKTLWIPAVGCGGNVLWGRRAIINGRFSSDWAGPNDDESSIDELSDQRRFCIRTCVGKR